MREPYYVPFDAIRCIDCGCILAQYEHYHDNGIEGYGMRDTIERAGSADSLRCGKCYQKYAFGRSYER